jgi:hypothetical protein
MTTIFCNEWSVNWMQRQILREAMRLPFSIFIDVIENGSEDAQKKKCQLPVKLLAPRQAVISTQIPSHPEPKPSCQESENL